MNTVQVRMTLKQAGDIISRDLSYKRSDAYSAVNKQPEMRELLLQKNALDKKVEALRSKLSKKLVNPIKRKQDAHQLLVSRLKNDLAFAITDEEKSVVRAKIRVLVDQATEIVKQNKNKVIRKTRKRRA